MLYLNKITMHNFKSFKNATIKFNDGFNCIVGPNGSGKSNICDALLFVLGETSLKRIRASSTKQLVSAFKQKNEAKQAYVSAVFSGDTEVNISRLIKPNGKVGYRLDGKHMTRQEVLDFLKTHNCVIGEANTITQGEIGKLLELSPKERRGLIDAASGIKEFDDKKNASIKELDKVEEKITNAKIMLNERKGFLEELKKEKETAEKYAELNAQIKRANYTILVSREKEVESALRETISKAAEAKEKLQVLKARNIELSVVKEKLSDERNEKAKALNMQSSAVNAINKKLEELNRDLAVSETEINGLDNERAKADASINELNTELENLKRALSENLKAVESLNAEIGKIEDEAGKYKKDDDAFYEEEAAVKYERLLKVIEEISVESEQQAETHAKMMVEIEKLNGSGNAVSAELEKVSHQLQEYEKGRSDKANESSQNNSLLQKLAPQIEALSRRKKELEGELYDYGDKKISLKEAMASYGGDLDKVNRFLKENIKAGFYGRAFELCKYEEKYSNAVAAAAGGRLNFFVVDTIEIADRAVKQLREKGIGRASFIPLDRINYAASSSSEGEPLINFIEYDKKFSNAFRFIFSNTNLVSDIKRVRVGSGRFVTIEGEVLEQSGVVSGGVIKGIQYQKVMAELRSVEENEMRARNEISSLEQEQDKIKAEFGRAEARGVALNAEIDSLSHSADALNVERQKLEKSAEQNNAELVKLQSAEAELNAKIAEAGRRLSELKTESAEQYKKLSVRINPKAADRAANKDNKERLKQLIALLEEKKLKRAAIGKEAEMTKRRIDELIKQISRENDSLKEAESRIKGIQLKAEGLKSEKKVVEEKIMAHSKNSATSYEEIKAIEDKISGIGFEIGKATGDLERLERDQIGFDASKSQMETRLADIKAELSGFESMEQVEGSVEGLEKEVARMKALVEALGNVNMRAPEMYAEKSRGVDEVLEKLGTLENEKNSILSMISQIESKKLEVFYETFNMVNENFKKLYPIAFGGMASISLDNPKDPFNSGLAVNIKNEKLGSAQVVPSGGERSMIMLMIIFAIQMCKPLSFYIFDEIDTALDKENSKKLSALIKQMSGNSQFIVVSHNDTLISYADTAIGVAKRDGESNVFGVEIVGNKASVKANQ